MKFCKFLSLLLTAVMILSALTFTASASAYTDVPESRWSYEDVVYASGKGYMTGIGNGKFNPAGTMKRAMIVTVLYRMENEPSVKYTAKFTDVPAGKYYSDAVMWAVDTGIVTGMTKNTFAPDGDVTREQMATFFARYAKYKNVNTGDTAEIKGYSDYGKISSYAVDAFAWANKVELISGDTETTLSPKKTATREQFAAVLHRFDTSSKMTYNLVYNEPIPKTSYTAKEYSLVNDADIYVSVTGNDSADGSLSNPVKTFERAMELVREKKATVADGIVVAFKAGKYSDSGIHFTAEDSGSEDCPITYCKYGDGDVVFSDGVEIPEENFTPITDADKYLFNSKYISDIKKVNLSGEIDEMGFDNILFSETSTCYEARYPNKNSDGTDNYFKDMTTTVDPKASIEIQSSLIQRKIDGFRTIENMRVTGFLRTGWLVDTFTVKSYDSESHILTFDFTKPFRNTYSIDDFELAYEDRMDDTVFFSNLSDQLDYEGEYWFNPDTKDLFVYAPEGDYTISRGGTFITVDSGCKYLNFTGLTFADTSETALYNSGNNIVFDGCTFKNIAGDYAIYSFNTNNIEIRNSEFCNFTGSGIYLKGATNRSILEECGNVVDNNYFHDFSLPDSFGFAFRLDGVAGRASHNYLKNGGHGGILYAGIGNIIEYNVFDNMMTTTEDFGAVYTGQSVTGRSTVIRYNLFKNMKTGAKYGIYLDDITCGQEIYGNIFYNAGGTAIVLNGGRDNSIHDNIVISTDSYYGYTTSNYGKYELVLANDTAGIESLASSELLNLWKPKEGEEGYDLWYSKWPILYNYNFDPAKAGETECFFTTVNYYNNNAVFTVSDTKLLYGAGGELFAEKNDITYTLDENPLFVDPTHGDYNIRDGVDFPTIPFDEIGMY